MPPSKSAEYNRRGDAHHPAATVSLFNRVSFFSLMGSSFNHHDCNGRWVRNGRTDRLDPIWHRCGPLVLDGTALENRSPFLDPGCRTETIDWRKTNPSPTPRYCGNARDCHDPANVDILAPLPPAVDWPWCAWAASHCHESSRRCVERSCVHHSTSCRL